MPWDVNQVQGGNGYDWNGANQNRNNQGNRRNQNYYQKQSGFMPTQSLQTGEPRKFTQATWNTPSRYIPVDHPNIPSGMGQQPV